MLLPVKDAAAALGVSVTSIRRGLKSGRLQGQRQETPQGHIWLVHLPDDQAGDSRVAGDRPPDSRVAGQGAQMPNLAQRAEDMARYSATLLAPLHAQLAAQAERIGRLELELEMAKAGDRASDPRPWWQRLFS